MQATPKLLLLMLFFYLVPTARAGNTWYVDGVNGSDTNDCMTPPTACLTIGHAVSLASAGDSVMIAPSVYTENLTITPSLTLTGASAETTMIDGGGARVISIFGTSAHVALSNLTIRNGVASGGGGILNWGTLTVSNSTISGNGAISEVSAAGGGIYSLGALTINNSSLSGNTAAASFVYGGAVYSTGPLAINNSTLSGNSATGRTGGGGGGIYVAGGTAKVSNSTVAGNGGTSGGNIANGGGTVTLQNTIVANSSAGGNCYGTMSSKAYNLSSDATCHFKSTGDRNNTNPKLGPLQNNGGSTNTQALLTGSPAIDKGNPHGCKDDQGHLLTTDQRGQPRPDHEDKTGCDIGAYERQSD